jgi:hypothetical protein
MSTCLLQGLPTHAVKGSQGGGGGGGCTEGSSERGGGIEPRHGVNQGIQSRLLDAGACKPNSANINITNNNYKKKFK